MGLQVRMAEGNPEPPPDGTTVLWSTSGRSNRPEMATLLSEELTEEGGAGRWTAVSASVRVSDVTTAMAEADAGTLGEATPPPAPPTPGLLTVAAVVVVVVSAPFLPGQLSACLQPAHTLENVQNFTLDLARRLADLIESPLISCC